MIAKFDKNISIYLNWKNADKLSDAWFIYASEDFKNQYRNSGSNQSNSNAVRHMMEKDVCRLIDDTEFIALGIQTYPKSGNEPERISAMMFASDVVQIDWKNSCVDGLGKKFNDVRLCVSNFQISELDIQASPTPPKRGGGRTSTYSMAKVILLELFNENKQYEKTSAAKLLPIFNELYLNKYASSKIKIAPLAERTLRNHLKKYRQELAAIDKNNFAN